VSNGSAITRAKVYRALVVVLVVALIPLGLFITVSAWSNRHENKAIAGGVTTTGEIVGISANGISGNGIRGGPPLIAFTDETGKRVVIQATGSVSRPQIGSTVTVFYKPSDPSDATDISDSNALWPVHLIIGLFIAAIGGWGTWMIWSKRRWAAAVRRT
jgi:hypothetical protein